MFGNLQKIIIENEIVYLILILLTIIWSFFWKGLSLWRAAKLNQKYWFVIILIINTLGILEIIYLAFFQKKSKASNK